jgi:hypothetical protein
MAGDTPVVADAKNLRQFLQGKAQLKRPLCKLNALDGRQWKYAIAAIRSLRSGENAYPFIVS